MRCTRGRPRLLELSSPIVDERSALTHALPPPLRTARTLDQHLLPAGGACERAGVELAAKRRYEIACSGSSL
eukprot:882460-Pleurochrysis_carterae.AAC.1